MDDLPQKFAEAKEASKQKSGRSDGSESFFLLFFGCKGVLNDWLCFDFI